MTREHWIDEHGVTHEADLATGRLLCTTAPMDWWPQRRHATTLITCLSCVTRAARSFNIFKILEPAGMKGQP